jgi:hypothetical protein
MDHYSMTYHDAFWMAFSIGAGWQLAKVASIAVTIVIDKLIGVRGQRHD